MQGAAARTDCAAIATVNGIEGITIGSGGPANQGNPGDRRIGSSGRSEAPGSLQTHLAPVLGGGRFMQPGADGGDTRDRTGKSSCRNWRFDQASIVKLSIFDRQALGWSAIRAWGQHDSKGRR
jgi:hypothetical protein